MPGYLEYPEVESDETEWDDLMAMPEDEAHRYLDAELARLEAAYAARRARQTPLQEYREDRLRALMMAMANRRRLRDDRFPFNLDCMREMHRDGLRSARIWLARLRTERATGCRSGTA